LKEAIEKMGTKTRERERVTEESRE